MKKVYLLLQTLQEKFSSFTLRQRVSLIVTIFVLLAIPITLAALKYQQIFRSKAAGQFGRIVVYEPDTVTENAGVADTNSPDGQGFSKIVNSSLVTLHIYFPNWNEPQTQIPSENKFASFVKKVSAQTNGGCADSRGWIDGDSTRVCSDWVQGGALDAEYCYPGTKGANASNVNSHYFSNCPVSFKPTPTSSVGSLGTGGSYCCGDNSRKTMEGGSCNGSFDDGLNSSTGYKNYYCSACAGKKDSSGKSYEVCYTCQAGENCESGSSSTGRPTLTPVEERITACADDTGAIWNNSTGVKYGDRYQCSPSSYSGDVASKQSCYDAGDPQARKSGLYASGYNAYLFEGCPVIQQKQRVGQQCTADGDCGTNEYCDKPQGQFTGVCRASGSGSGGGTQPTTRPTTGQPLQQGTKERGQQCSVSSECVGGFVCGAEYGSGDPTPRCIEVVERAGEDTTRNPKCVNSLECVDDYVCRLFDDPSPATCVHRSRFNNIITRGRNCGLEQNNCDTGLSCKDYSNTKICLTSTKVVPEGQFCYTTDECQEGFTCDTNNPDKKNVGICKRGGATAPRYTRYLFIKNENGDFNDENRRVTFGFSEQESLLYTNNAFIIRYYALSDGIGQKDVVVRFCPTTNPNDGCREQIVHVEVKKLQTNPPLEPQVDQAMEGVKQKLEQLGKKVTITDGSMVIESGGADHIPKLTEFENADLEFLVYVLKSKLQIHPYFALCHAFNGSDQDRSKLYDILLKYGVGPPILPAWWTTAQLQTLNDPLYKDVQGNWLKDGRGPLPLPCSLNLDKPETYAVFPFLRNAPTREYKQQILSSAGYQLPVSDLSNAIERRFFEDKLSALVVLEQLTWQAASIPIGTGVEWAVQMAEAMPITTPGPALALTWRYLLPSEPIIKALKLNDRGAPLGYTAANYGGIIVANFALMAVPVPFGGGQVVSRVGPNISQGKFARVLLGGSNKFRTPAQLATTAGKEELNKAFSIGDPVKIFDLSYINSKIPAPVEKINLSARTDLLGRHPKYNLLLDPNQAFNKGKIVYKETYLAKITQPDGSTIELLIGIPDNALALFDVVNSSDYRPKFAQIIAQQVQEFIRITGRTWTDDLLLSGLNRYGMAAGPIHPDNEYIAAIFFSPDDLADIVRFRGSSEVYQKQGIATFWHELEHSYKKWTNSSFEEFKSEVYSQLFSVIVARGNMSDIFIEMLKNPGKLPKYAEDLRKTIKIMRNAIKDVDGTIVEGTDLQQLMQINQYFARATEEKIEAIIRRSIDSPKSAEILAAP